MAATSPSHRQDGGAASGSGPGADTTASVLEEFQDVYSGSAFKISSLFPPITWLPSYIRASLGRSTESDLEAMGDLKYSIKGDLISGLTVGCMLVPQCLAFALLAGLPVRAGLYSSFAPLLMYALLGTLRQLQVGPTSLMSLLTGSALDAAGYMTADQRMAGAAMLAVAVAASSLLLGVLRLGFVVDFMSHSVMSSFCTASGVIIATSQMKHLLGIQMARKHYWWETVHGLASGIKDADVATLALGFTLLGSLIFLKSWKTAGKPEARAKHPLWRWLPCHKESRSFQALKLVADLSSLACVIVGWIWGYIYRQAGIQSVRLIGASQINGFIIQIPSSMDFNTLIVPGMMMAIVGFLETVAVGGKLASEKRYSYDPNQELLALGLANGAGALMAGFPITGGFSRTAVNAMFGATSQLAGGLTSCVVLIATYVLMPVVEELPLAALAPLIIHGALGVTNFSDFVTTYRANKADFLVMLATFAVSLALSVKEGLIVGVTMSLMKVLYDVANPNMAICGRVEDGTFRDIRYYPEGLALMPSNCIVVRMDARLSFTNSRRLQEFCLRAARIGEVTEAGTRFKYLILDCKSINGIDMTSCEKLEALACALQRRGQILLLASLKAPLAKALCSCGVHRALIAHGGHVCWSMDQALAIAQGEDPELALKSVLDLERRVKEKSLPNSVLGLPCKTSCREVHV